MTSDDDLRIDEIMETEIISVTTHTDKEEVARLFSKYDLLALPVLDADGRMVGIVTIDDAMDVMEEEATEDITKMAAINPSEDSYFETSILSHAKNKIVWLFVLMLSATVTGAFITRYQDAFSAIPLLVSFIPMLMDTGGNCDSQSSTLIISKLIGCILPLLAKKVHLDPAIMAAPLITTIVDTCSIVVYFTIATFIFHL